MTIRSGLLALVAAALLAAGLASAQSLPYYVVEQACATTCTVGPIQTGPGGVQTVEVQATGTGSGLTFSVTGLPINGAANRVTLPLIPLTAGIPGSPIQAGSANGDYLVAAGGFSNIQVSLSAIGGGTETFTLTGTPALSPLLGSGGGVIFTVPGPYTASALAQTSVTAGTAVNVTSAANAAKGGQIQNCNASGTMYVNDVTTATQTESGSTQALAPGLNGTGGSWNVAPGSVVSVNFSTGTGTICGRQWK